LAGAQYTARAGARFEQAFRTFIECTILDSRGFT